MISHDLSPDVSPHYKSITLSMLIKNSKETDYCIMKPILTFDDSQLSFRSRNITFDGINLTGGSDCNFWRLLTPEAQIGVKQILKRVTSQAEAQLTTYTSRVKRKLQG